MSRGTRLKLKVIYFFKWTKIGKIYKKINSSSYKRILLPSTNIPLLLLFNRESIKVFIITWRRSDCNFGHFDDEVTIICRFYGKSITY